MTPESRTSEGRFQKGKSGNPGGVPAVVLELKAIARSHCPRALERLAQLIESDDERVAVAAATAILDRGVGKPTQAMELSGPDGEPLKTALDLSKLSNDELKTLHAITAKAKGE